MSFYFGDAFDDATRRDAPRARVDSMRRHAQRAVRCAVRLPRELGDAKRRRCRSPPDGARPPRVAPERPEREAFAPQQRPLERRRQDVERCADATERLEMSPCLLRVRPMTPAPRRGE